MGLRYDVSSEMKNEILIALASRSTIPVTAKCFNVLERTVQRTKNTRISSNRVGKCGPKKTSQGTDCFICCLVAANPNLTMRQLSANLAQTDITVSKSKIH